MVARVGIKRRASSPPRETNHPHQFGFYAPGGMSEIPPHRNPNAFSFGGFTNPGTRVHGSVSSLSSYPSYRNPSLASSTGYSVTASSMTSVEGPLSPLSDIESPYENMVSPNSRVPMNGLSLQATPTHREMESKPPAVVTRKFSTIPDFSPAKSQPTKIYERMRWKSNTPVNIVISASRIGMKPKDIVILYTFDVTHGHVQHCRVTRPPFTLRPQHPAKHQAAHRAISAASAAKSLLIFQNQTGRHG
ncbi:hypothetical protein KEM54_004120 [Ascosphaera aggregata]|nr:hypothetical protein KEM54_004120 [Ascosphaera aggregata]